MTLSLPDRAPRLRYGTAPLLICRSLYAFHTSGETFSSSWSPQPLWLLHLPRIVEELRRLPVPVLDRAAIEKLFGLKRRQAIQLLDRFGGYQAGRTFLVDRQELVEQLEAIRDGETFRYEQRRRRRLVAELESVRKYLQAAAVKIPLRPQARYQIDPLPPDVDLQPGRLRVEFDGVEDLLSKLFELAHSAANDFVRFRNAVESAQNSQKV